MPKLEHVAEDRFAEYIEYKTDDYCIKLYKTHWPDRLIVLKKGVCFFIEFKKEVGGVLSKGQVEMISRLRKNKQYVYVCTTFEEAMAAYKKELKRKRFTE